ncbi:GNAT family N-acetyltransferase [Halobacillus sp. BAB-2008]|uniref:GNAT family N-acetyltransferase n=1 Tax=Halobacillus sp. BAB-2008 TaxID=1246484 RepID=UPI0002A4FFD3|nr:GNAT family N-acetyltransferase [Halobacillus sp. BAB-2008]ELK48504.1 polyamine N-acetyltransferase [Halobacillus sp. BAB-2008]
MDIHIKACGQEQAHTLLSIGKETFYDTFAAQNTEKNMNDYLAQAYTIERMEAELAEDDSFFYCMFVDGVLAGYLKVNIGDSQSEPMGEEALEVERIYIRKAFHRQGLGRRLLTYALDLAGRWDKSEVWLGVWEKNEPALVFYERLGFRRIGEHSFYMGEDEQTDYLMAKTLKEET